MVYYKVLANRNNRLESAIASPCHNVGLVYEPEVWISPTIKNSKLFVFETLQNAMDFIEQASGEYTIYQCEVTNPEKYDWWTTTIVSWLDLRYVVVDDYWNNSRLGQQSLPFGTVLVDSLKLTRKVY